MHLTENAKKVLERRYLRKDAGGRPAETPAQMFRRVARHIAQAELNYDANADVQAAEEMFYELMTDLKFLPNSPTLMNAGRRLGQLAACFVLPVEDCMEDIFEALKNAAIIHKSGGGTGFSFSRLRPKNAMVGTTGGVASGPVSFMSIFDQATGVIVQGGRRRGANMGILRCDHPDIVEFVEAKIQPEKFVNFNLSVAVTGRFMTAVADNSDFPLVNPRTGKTVKSIRARDLFELIVSAAWRTGDPGLVFLDRINKHNPTPS
ncbi:MAG: ribonucleotide-diphosphate reductase subunit alpha, partial [Desulfobacteraceae bacterium]